ncbi:hypothetical protein [Nocardiopsis nanhaiensis]
MGHTQVCGTDVMEREDTAMDRQIVAERFRLKEIIDRGNMGGVHRAEDQLATDEHRDQDVAVKLILRRRSGFRLVTSHRFQDLGDRLGRQDAVYRLPGAQAAVFVLGPGARPDPA